MSSASESTAAPRPSRLNGVVCWLLLLLLFFVYAGSPPPGVNEPHYLGKAKHYWNSGWCPDDFFLDSQDAHRVFYWSFGWVTRFLSLTATAWVGRVLTWGLLAWAWLRLARASIAWSWGALVSAALFVALQHDCRVAGEWIIGGVEAKGFAYVLVLLALAELVRNRYSAAWLLLGAATAMHVLVGGWSMVAAAIGWLVVKRDRPRLISMLPALVAAVVVALAGLWPAAMLNAETSAEVTREADQIYVFTRLAHHLLLTQFGLWPVLPGLALLAAWGAIVCLVPAPVDVWRLRGFVLGAVAIAACGVAIELALRGSPATEAAIMKYYWYRLVDVALPLGMTAELVRLPERFQESRPRLAAGLQAATILAAMGLFGPVYYQQQLAARPAADAGPWYDVCRWIAEQTDSDATFLTPGFQSTFKWYAGRSEVVTWKDVPQDAAAVIEWRRRMEEIYGNPQTGPWQPRWRSLTSLTGEELSTIARQYDVDYIVFPVPVLVDSRSQREFVLRRVYPNNEEANQAYSVYQVFKPEKGRSAAAKEPAPGTPP